MQNILYLGSKSSSRKKLITQAKIPFILVGQDADETLCDWALPLPQVVAHIARFKMDHVVLPAGKDGESCFVLTGDTLGQGIEDGAIHGKPIDRADAVAKIKAARQGMVTGTAFCLDKKMWNGSSWQTVTRIERYVDARYTFDIPDNLIERYFDSCSALECSGAIAIEEYGAQFLQVVQGSYSAIVGLPMFELRQALEELGFW